MLLLSFVQFFLSLLLSMVNKVVCMCVCNQRLRTQSPYCKDSLRGMAVGSRTEAVHIVKQMHEEAGRLMFDVRS